MALGFRGPVSAVLFLAACASGSHATNVVPAAPNTPAPALGPHADLFLVRAVEAGQVLVMSSTTGVSRVITRSSGGLHQAELGLFWFREEAELKVLDLDKLDERAVTVADGLRRLDRFAIVDHDASVYVEDGCDELPSLELSWTDEPALQLIDEGEPPRITNRAWLKRELDRPTRPIGARKQLSNARTLARVPKRMLDCESPTGCGTVLPLGSTGIELVLVRHLAGGDCLRTACMLHDPRTKLYAKPPHAESWGKADPSLLGSCGPYNFDRSNTRFLVDDKLCTADGCQTLVGPALGWLEPGDVIGEPGVTDVEDEEGEEEE
jgi:hypothetical protein